MRAGSRGSRRPVVGAGWLQLTAGWLLTALHALLTDQHSAYSTLAVRVGAGGTNLAPQLRSLARLAQRPPSPPSLLLPSSGPLSHLS